jgi:uncharacterized protein (TIGR02453 family)
MPAKSAAAHFDRSLPAFLGELEKHNERRWFEAHRKEYEAALVAPAKAFVAALGPKLAKLSPELRAESAFNGSIARMNRDTRFSKDKTPYKTSLHLRFWWGPEQKTAPSFHLGIGSKTFGVGAGAYAFQPDQLARYRDAVVDEASGPALQRALKQALKASGSELRGLHYKKVPRGFDAEHPNAELLRHAGLFTVRDGRLPAEIFDAKATAYVVSCFRDGLPLVKWLAEHVGPSRASKRG